MEPIPSPIRGELMTPQEVAKKLRVSIHTIYHMTTNGELPAHRIRCSLRFDSADVDDYLFFSKFNYSGFKLLSAIDKEQIMNRFEDQMAHLRRYIEKFINKSRNPSKKQ